MIRRFMTVMVLLGMAASACRKPMKLVLTKDQRMRIAQNILKKAPTPMFKSGAIFGNNIEFIGMDVEPKESRPGGRVTLTYYWKCLKKVSGPWKVFVHFELPQGRRMVLDHVPIHELYPIENWKPGQVIRDVQTVTVDQNAKPGVATIWLGLYNVDVYRTQGANDRMKLVNPGKVTNDGHNRVKGATVRILPKGKTPLHPGTTKKAVAPQRPRLTAMRLLKKNIIIDGDLDEQDWRTAFYTPPFQKAMGGVAAPQDRTVAAMIYDEKYLYIGFKVVDSDIHSEYKHRDDTIWKQDAVEVYLDPLEDGKDYIELQVSPANQVFDALFSSHRTPDWHVADKYNIPGLKTYVRVNGTLNDDSDVDVGWTVEIAVPWKALKGINSYPPKTGTRMTVNFFRINYNHGKIVGAFAFSPAGGDFHNLSRAGEAVFVGYPTEMLKAAIKNSKDIPKARIKNARVIMQPVHLPHGKFNVVKQMIRLNRARLQKQGKKH